MTIGIIKNVYIPSTDFPAINNDGTIVLRYRLTSLEGTKISQWSQKYSIDLSALNVLLSDVSLSILQQRGSVTSDGVGISVSWSPLPNLQQTSYDIFTSWSSDGITYTGYSYQTTVSSNSSYVLIPTPAGSSTLYGYAKVAVQLSAYQKTLTSKLLVFQKEGFVTQATALPGISGFDGGTLG